MPHSDAAPLLRCEQLEKSFSGVPVLKRVSLAISRGEMVCIVGENGAGKSTLMNVIGGVHQPDAGSMWFADAPHRPANPLDAARQGIAFVHQELNVFGNLTIAENLFLTSYPIRRIFGIPLLDRGAGTRRARRLLADVGLEKSPGMLVEQLSQGDRQLVEIAKALGRDARFIIFDEPTTSLTSREIERLFGIIAGLRERGIAVLYISHALEHVMALADRIVVLRDGAVADSGTRDEFTVEKLIHAMVGRSIEQLYPPRDRSIGTEAALQVDGVSAPGVVDKVSFEIRSGEIVGVAGLMGSGRSELARIVFGLDSARRGRVRVYGESLDGLPPRARIARGLAFVTESRREDGLFMGASIDENVRIVHPGTNRTAELIRDLHITCSDAKRQAVAELSGGNQQKVAVAKWLAKPPRVLILDEPTRGIDVGAKHEMYNLITGLAKHGLALLIISSEVEELVGVCDRILVMAQGEIRGEFRAGCTREEIMRAAV